MSWAMGPHGSTQTTWGWSPHAAWLCLQIRMWILMVELARQSAELQHSINCAPFLRHFVALSSTTLDASTELWGWNFCKLQVGRCGESIISSPWNGQTWFAIWLGFGDNSIRWAFFWPSFSVRTTSFNLQVAQIWRKSVGRPGSKKA